MATAPIVVAVDGSEESLRAAEWAALEAHRHGAPLRIVSAPAMPLRIRAGDAYPTAAASALRTVSVRALREAVTRAEELAPGLLISTDLLPAGMPALAVTDSGSGALMLVVGARGAGGFAAMLLGSVSRYAAMHARCPVVVVRAETSAVHREIVVGIRDSHDAAETLAFAFAEAEMRGATLVALHSWYWFPSQPGESAAAGASPGHLTDPEHISAESDADLAEALRPWQEKYPAVPVRRDVVHGHPARLLASYSVRADLVVIGRHRQPGTGMAIGAIQHAILSHSHGPVIVVPAEA